MIAGSIALLFLLIAAVRLISSAGNKEAQERGKQGIFYAILGLIVTILSYSIVRFILDSLL